MPLLPFGRCITSATTPDFKSEATPFEVFPFGVVIVQQSQFNTEKNRQQPAYLYDGCVTADELESLELCSEVHG